MKSRRSFLKIIVAGIISFFIVVWNKLTLIHIEINKDAKKVFPINKNKTVSFDNDYIIVSENNTTTVLSSHCTHLGCKIDKMVGDHFVCPCHGSEYDMNGKVIKGPAYKNLETVPFQISEDGKSILIES
jgi:Rieske Fe-S protein